MVIIFSNEELRRISIVSEKVMSDSLDCFERVFIQREKLIMLNVSGFYKFPYFPNCVNWYIQDKDSCKLQFNNLFSLESKSFIWKEWIISGEFFDAFVK